MPTLARLALVSCLLAGCDPSTPTAEPDARGADLGLAADAGSTIDGAVRDGGSGGDAGLDASIDVGRLDMEPSDPPDRGALDQAAPDALTSPRARFAINEVGCRGDEFVELYALAAGDAAGFSITDDPSDPERALALPDAPVDAGQIIALADLPFGVACDETISLLDPDGAVAAAVELGEPREGTSYGRLPDGEGAWGETTPTPGEPNAPPPPPQVRLNEVDCHGRAFIEVVNIGETAADLRGWRVTDTADDPDSGHLLDGVTLDVGAVDAVRRQTPDDAGFRFGVACGVDTISLVDPSGAIVDAVAPPPLAAAYTWGRLPDGVGEWTRTDASRGEPNRPPVDPGGDLFDPMRVFTLDFEVTPQALAALDAEPRAYTEAVMRYEDGEPMPVGLRLKGRAGSFRTLDRKSAFKVDMEWIDPDGTLLGLRRLTLNNMVQDRSMLHEWTAYTIFREMGVAAPRVGYAWIRINGEDYGLYSHIETPEDEMLDRWFASTRHLYEGAYGADLFPDHVGRFDRDEGDEAVRADLEGLITEMHAVEPADFYAASADRVDWPQVLAMMLTEIYIGHWDGYAPTRNNYFLHFDDDAVVRLMPWGTDQTFDRLLDLRAGNGLLLDRCRAAPACMDAYDETLVRLVDTVDALDLPPRIEALEAALRPWVEADPRRTYDVPAVERAVDDTIAYLTRRRQDLGALSDCLAADDRDPDGDGFSCDRDCAPDDPLTFPGAPEICGDGLDQDCNGVADDAPECPDCQEIARAGHRYLVCTTPRSYEASADRCREHGAEMWIADGPEESAWVYAAAMAVRAQDYWIGFDDRAREGTFVWPDGVERAYTDWNDGEPNNAGNEDCAQLRRDNGRWNDLPCDRRLAVICEDPCAPGTDADGDGANGCGIDCDDADPAQAPGLFDVCDDFIDQDCDGEVDNGDGCVQCTPIDRGPHRYLACQTRLPYLDARDACRDRGLDLAVLADPAELGDIADAARAIEAAEYWVGLDDRAREGTFVWADGREVAPDTPWNPGEPNDYGAGEDCAHLVPGHTALNDLGCASPRAFICEATCRPGVDGDGDGVLRCDGDCDDSDPAVGRCR